MPAVANIKLGDTMVHEVPRGSASANPDRAVILSEDLTELDTNTDRFIREQMLHPFLPDGRDIVAAPQANSDGTGSDDASGDGAGGLELVPRLVKEILADGSTLPEHSRAIAEHMFQTQVGSASAGIFLASLATSNVGDCVVMLKAEHQEGVRLRHSGTANHVAFEVEHITELIVGKNSKVYKIAMLWVRESDGAVVGKMVDKQNGAAYADYFLDRFLGMGLRHQSEKLTRDLLESSTKHINTDVDPDKRTRYTRALVALLESPHDEINTSQFIRTFIDPEDQDDFAAALPAPVLSAFRKDTTLIKGRIGGMVFDLQQGAVQVRATSEAVAEGLVEVDQDNERMILKGLPENIAASKPPK